LQSLNEELETSKEELQSTNEELTVLNHELTGLNEQITDARNYSESIVATLYQPLLVLDKHLRVKTANKAFYKTFKVDEQETEGVLIYDLGNRQWNIPELRTLLEEILPQKKQITDFEVTHNFTSIGERIILLSALELTREKKEEKLILLSIEDITEKKLAQKKLEESEHTYHMMLMNSPFAFSIMKGKDMVVTLANDLMKYFWGKGQQVEGKPMFEVLPELIDQPFPALLDKVYTSGEPVNANEILARLNRNGTMEERYFNIVYQPHFEADKTISGVITIAHEVTNQVLARKQIEDSNKRYNMLLMQSPIAFAILKGKDMVVILANDSVKEMWGKGKEVEGKPLLEVIPELKDQQFPELLNDVYTTGIPYSSYQSLVRLQRNGKMEDAYFNFAYQPYFEADETISGVVIIATEVTPLAALNKKIKASEEKFKLLVLQAPVAICVLRGENYVVETMNERMCELWDRTLQQALNKLAFDVLPELRDQGIKELLDNVYHTGERCVMQELSVNLMRNGKLENIFVKFVYEAMREADGSISGVMALAHEITEQVTFRKKIEESDKRFQAAVSAVEGIVWTNNAKGEMQGEQLGWSFLTGQSYEEYQGYGWVKAVHPDDKQPTIDAWNKAVRERRNFIFQHRVKGRDGNWRHFSIKAIPLFSEDGSLSEWVGVHTDVTDQYRAEKAVKESENRFRQMAELMPQKVWTADAKGNKTYFNKTLLDYAGYSFEELKGDGWQKIIHPEDWEIDKIKWEKSISTGQDYDVENRLLRKDGKYLWHLTRAVALKDETGEIKMWVGAKTEIQKIKEEEVRKGDFIKMVSHELKTPVTSIKGYVQMLLSMLKDNPETEVAGLPLLSSLTRIDSQVLRLTRLITEMLDLTRLETGKLELKKELFGLEELVNETVKDITYTNTKHIINIHTDFNGMVYGDKDRLGQVLINIINNAIKYSTENNQIDVTIYQPENNLIAVSVKDYGIGINKTDQLKIFERFYRAGGMSEQTYAGFGIGLYIAHEIMERHQGFISVDSEEGKGSTFTFTLPLATTNEI